MSRFALLVFAAMIALSFPPLYAQTTASEQSQQPPAALKSAWGPSQQLGRAAPPAESAWWQSITDIQQTLHNRLAQAIRGLKSGEPLIPGMTLIVISFLYGVFHAVGPGHGKAVISAYVLANNVTLRRGVAISFAAAFVQALTALAIIGVIALLFGVMGLEMRKPISQVQIETMAWLITISAALVALTGAWMFASAVRRLWNAGSGTAKAAAAKPHAHTHTAGCECGCSCGHAHMPDPTTLERGFSWKRAAAIAFMVGIRPCTGALVVLVVAGGQGLYWAGVAATFLMAIGTAITVSTIAVVAVASREAAVRLTGAGRAERVYQYATVGGSLLLLLLGAGFFAASLGPAHPF